MQSLEFAGFKIIESPGHSLVVDGSVMGIQSSGRSQGGHSNRIRSELSLERHLAYGKNEDQGILE